MEKGPDHATFPWHQDFPFWPVDAPIGAVVWAALDPINAISGGLHIAVGSHVLGAGPSIDLHAGHPQLAGNKLPDFARYQTVSPVLAPGDAIVFHPLV